MHPLRRQILYKLITNPFLPFSKLKPKEVESNLFIYHLKGLISEGLVQKRTDGKYELTPEGNIFADKLSLENFKPRIQPKIITLIVCQNKKKELLLYKRNRQPVLGLVGFPYGKIHLGEKVAQAAERELREKTGVKANLLHRADVYLTTYREGDILSEVFCHVFEGKNPKGELNKNSEIGECFWEKVTDFSDKKYIPGFKNVYKLVKKPSKNLVFAEFVYNL
ncbi:MAG: NUDIX domain-containing protein [Candidatus Daviesbacteria bacterium]